MLNALENDHKNSDQVSRFEPATAKTESILK